MSDESLLVMDSKGDFYSAPKEPYHIYLKLDLSKTPLYERLKQFLRLILVGKAKFVIV